jgi:ABC-type uncharacterized transport system auxiliary subunit
MMLDSTGVHTRRAAYRGRALWVTLLLPWTLAGCFSVDLEPLNKDAPVRSRYLLDVPGPDTPSAAAPVPDRVLLVEPVYAASPYDGRLLVYRTGPHRHEFDYYHEFLISPAEQLTQILRLYLGAAGVARRVVDSDSQAVADTLLSIDLRELRGDYRDPTQPAACVTLRAVLLGRDAAGELRAVRLAKDYATRVALPVDAADHAADPAALVAGFSQALSALLAQLGADLRGVGGD